MSVAQANVISVGPFKRLLGRGQETERELARNVCITSSMWLASAYSQVRERIELKGYPSIALLRGTLFLHPTSWLTF